MTNFLDLPPEIRNRIYFYTGSLVPTLVFKEPQCISVVDGGNCMYRRHILSGYYPRMWPSWAREAAAQFPVQPNVTRTCRQIRAETLPIFYGANQFLIAHEDHPHYQLRHSPFPKALFDRLNRIKPHLSLITSMQVEVPYCGCAQRAHKIVAALTDEFAFNEGALSVWTDRAGA